MKWLADKVTSHPRITIICLLCLLCAAAVGIPRIQFRFNFRTLYNYDGNADVEVLDRYTDEFGDDGGFVAAIVKSDRIFGPEVLRYVQETSRALEASPLFWRVRSLSTRQVPWGEGDEVNTGRLYDSVPTNPAELKKLKKIALSSELLVPRVVSREGKLTLVAAEMKIPSLQATIEEQKAAVNEFRSILSRFRVPAGVEILVSGGPTIETEIQRILIRDQILFVSIALVLLVVVLLVVFGRLHGLLLPFTSVLLTMGFAVGLMGWLGASINTVSSTIPTVLFIYGMLDSIFVLSRFYEHVERGHNRKEAARLSIVQLGWPCLITSSTTALGFAAFAVTKLPLLQRYGFFLAIGVLFAYLASVIWLPALLCLVPTPRKGYGDRRLVRAVASFLSWIPFHKPRFRIGVMVASVLVLIASAWMATGNKLDAYYTRELPANAPAMKGNRVLSEQLSGEIRTAVVITGPEGTCKRPDVIKAIDLIDLWAEKQPPIRSSLSIADVIKAMHQAFNGGDPKYYIIPASPQLVAQYLAMMDPDTRSDFMRDDYSRTHVRILSIDMGSTVARDFFKRLDEIAKKHLKGLDVTVTGYGPTAYKGLDDLVGQMLGSYFIAFGIIAFLVLIAFRSFRAGILAGLPNLLPTVICLALLPIFDISLRLSTVLFLSVSVGIIYDNTIHLLAAIREERQQGADIETAVRSGIVSIGPPATYSAILIALGFGIFILSEFEALMVFGVCCISVVLMGLAADLLLTPALLISFGKKSFKPKGLVGADAPATKNE